MVTLTFAASAGRIARLSACLALVLFVLAACGRGSQQEPTPFPTSTPIAGPAAVSPAGSADSSTQAESPLAPESPLTQPNSPMPEPTTEPEPTAPAIVVTSPDLGGLTAVLHTSVDGTDRPLAGLIIGLAAVILDENGKPKASGYEVSAAPRTDTDGDGRFAFDSIKPGLYTLIADYVSAQVQLNDEKTGDTLLVEIKPGEVTDLGLLKFAKLPLVPN